MRMPAASKPVPRVDRTALIARAKAAHELNRRRHREAVLGSTVEFGKWSGSNSYDQTSGRYPRMAIQVRADQAD